MGFRVNARTHHGRFLTEHSVLLRTRSIDNIILRFTPEVVHGGHDNDNDDDDKNNRLIICL